MGCKKKINLLCTYPTTDDEIIYGYGTVILKYLISVTVCVCALTTAVL